MLDDVRYELPLQKQSDFLGRLRQKTDAAQVIGAEMELALIWGLRQLGHIQAEPFYRQGGDNNPDAFSNDLFGKPALIEITAVSDTALSGETLMRRASQKIVGYVNSVSRGSGKFLHFDFHEQTTLVKGHFSRQRRVTRSFELTAAIKDQLRDWTTKSKSLPGAQLRITDAEIDVTITRQPHKEHPLFNFFSSMPAAAYSLEENPIFVVLKDKEKQLADAKPGWLKCIFLADAGCYPLRYLTGNDPSRMTKSGAEIIHHFLSQSSVDYVIAISVKGDALTWPRSDRRQWAFTAFGREKRPNPEALGRIQPLPQVLPSPRFSGYQARTIHQQALFAPQARGWYLGTTTRTGKVMTIEISSRLVQELLAGRVTHERFHDIAFGKNHPNLFERWLKMGYTIDQVSNEKAGVDEDDDRLVFKFSRDPAASDLRLKWTIKTAIEGAARKGRSALRRLSRVLRAPHERRQTSSKNNQ